MVVFNSAQNKTSVRNEMKSLCLASASPRRRELLALLGVEFNVLPVDIPEFPHPQERAADYVQRLAFEKAMAGLGRSRADVALGSDTIVVCDGDILEKPENKQHYLRMLSRLSGREHQVLTAVSVVSNAQQYTELVVTKVNFRPLSASDLEWYWQTGEPLDKAGGYGIQGKAARFVCSINGSYTAVVGLPLCETEALLERVGIVATSSKVSGETK